MGVIWYQLCYKMNIKMISIYDVIFYYIIKILLFINILYYIYYFSAYCYSNIIYSNC